MWLYQCFKINTPSKTSKKNTQRQKRKKRNLKFKKLNNLYRFIILKTNLLGTMETL